MGDPIMNKVFAKAALFSMLFAANSNADQLNFKSDGILSIIDKMGEPNKCVPSQGGNVTLFFNEKSGVATLLGTMQITSGAKFTLSASSAQSKNGTLHLDATVEWALPPGVIAPTVMVNKTVRGEFNVPEDNSEVIIHVKNETGDEINTISCPITSRAP